jgi:hypothetical protein
MYIRGWWKLVIPYPNQSYKVLCDASKKGMGVILIKNGQVVA